MPKKDNKVVEVAAPNVVADANGASSNAFVRGTIGVLLLLVFGSIAFSTVVIFGGTDTLAPKILAAPAALFDLFIAFVAFSKILK